jgi:hypothetical protein
MWILGKTLWSLPNRTTGIKNQSEFITNGVGILIFIQI